MADRDISKIDQAVVGGAVRRAAIEQCSGEVSLAVAKLREAVKSEPLALEELGVKLLKDSSGAIARDPDGRISGYVPSSFYSVRDPDLGNLIQRWSDTKIRQCNKASSR